MGAVNTSLVEEARSIFTDLGYEVTDEGDEFRAERKWRVVYVTTATPEEAPSHGRFRCFVAREERADEIREELLDAEPSYDWAVVGVSDDDYHVLHPSASVLPAP